ncbi:MAG TPA: glycosyltransferase, partial [Candidatus Latescibacteria bacterium]|nr:glycosyltransferase [Candidatus Latescibacterota bacterium]
MELFRTAFLVLLALGATGYAVASVALWTGALRRSRRIPRGGDLPTVTVIVPARNEAANIASCLTALSRQSYPPHLCKIVVVDDRSDDGTGEIAARAACAMEAVVQVVRVDTVPPGWSPKKHALHRAILESTSDIILTTDADCEPEECWIEEMVASLSAADIVAGYSPFRQRGTL